MKLMHRSHLAFAIILLLGLFTGISRCVAQERAVPLIARYDIQGNEIGKDTGPLGITAKANNVVAVQDAQRGTVLQVKGNMSNLEMQHAMLNRMLARFTITAWVKVDRFPGKFNLNEEFLFWKGWNGGVQIGIQPDRSFIFHGNWGGGWYQRGSGMKVPQGEWVHIALVFEKNAKSRILLNGKQAFSDQTEFATWSVNDPLRFGSGNWDGELDNIRVYADALSDAQVQQDMQDQLPTRAPVDSDFIVNGYPVRMALTRFDMPAGLAYFDGRIKQDVKRVAGPNAVDWPKLTLEIPGKASLSLFSDGARQNVEVPLIEGGKAMPLFRQPYDYTVQPVNHWFRALAWIWGQYYIYSTDRTARTSGGDYEIWTFPVRIDGSGATDIQSVQLSVDGKVIYDRSEALHSLTLLLPANLNGKPYQLTVNGRGPVSFNVGLQPYVLGNPQDKMLLVKLTLPGDGPAINIATLDTPETFPNQRQWDDDQKALGDAKTVLTARPTFTVAHSAIANHLGLDVPRSPLSVNLSYQRHGMSGGQWLGGNHIDGFKGTAEEYAKHLANIGFDNDIESISGDGGNRPDDQRYVQWLNALAAYGIRGGLNPGNNSMAHSNMSFFSYNIPDFHAPSYRDAQLLAERFKDCPSFGGFVVGGDNAGYVSFWDWAPPIPNRPWGRSFIQFQQGNKLEVPVGPQDNLHASQDRRGTEKAFVDYINRYDQTFSSISYLSGAVSAVNPNLFYTSGSFGSSPGVGGRGGWPWASIPGKPMYQNLSLQMAYDWNEVSSSKPMHNVALVDRLRSYYPQKTTWSLIDDFGLFFGREARERAYALVLTRGVQGVGTNFLAHTTGNIAINGDGGPTGTRVAPEPREQIIAGQKELYAWIHRYGGVYAMTEPTPVIGILYVHEQAISRDSNTPDPQGPHEGKTTEALFMCHQAGWPAKIITPEEMQRDLPSSIKAILLVGLNKFDNTWIWSAGLEPAFQKFVQGGGRVITDHESVSPVPATASGMRIAAYITQRWTDATPDLLARNEENAKLLNTAMTGIAHPFAWSDSQTVWAVPTVAGNTQYLTVVNQAPKLRDELVGKSNTRVDAQLNFSWTTNATHDGCPMDGVSAQNFTATWIGQIMPRYSETYTFTLRADDNASLWIDGKLLLDKVSNNSATIGLQANKRYDIKVTLQQTSNNSAIQLLWQSPSQASEIVPSDCLFATAEAQAEHGLTGTYNGEVSYRYQNASRVVQPQVGTLNWNTTRPIYDVRLGRKLTPAEAKRCDLTQDAFRYYALPPAEITKPVCTVSKQADGFYYANVKIVNGTTNITGVPLSLTVTRGTDIATVYGATGSVVKLPLAATDAPGAYTITVQELLSGLTTATTVTVTPTAAPAATALPVTVYDRTAVDKFAARTQPLIVALTPQQQSDAAIVAQADRLVKYFAGKGRTVTKRTVTTNDLITSLQEYNPVQRYPQWSTVEADVILLGTAKNNLLLMDQGRGALLPQAALDIQPGQAVISYAWSPFRGEYDAINIVAADLAGITQGVDALTAGK